MRRRHLTQGYLDQIDYLPMDPSLEAEDSETEGALSSDENRSDPVHSFLTVPILGLEKLELRCSDNPVVDAQSLFQALRNDWNVYQALLRLARESGTKVADHVYQIQIGYADLAHASKCNARAIQRALPRLADRKYVYRCSVAHDGTHAATYWVRSEVGVMAMLEQSGCSHYRVLRGRRIQIFHADPPSPFPGCAI